MFDEMVFDPSLFNCNTVRLSHLNWGPYFLIDKIVTEKFDKKYNILSFSIVFMLSAIVLDWNGQIWVFTNICFSMIHNDLHFEKCYFLHLFCTSMQKPKIVFLVSQQINYTCYRQTSIWFEHWAQNTNLTLPLHSICFVMNLRIWKKNLGFSLCEAMHWLIVLENAWRFFFLHFSIRFFTICNYIPWESHVIIKVATKVYSCKIKIAELKMRKKLNFITFGRLFGNLISS